MKNLTWKLVYLPILVSLTCCKTSDDVNQFSDPVLRTIATFQDMRAADSLYRYFDHENVTYRREAVEAFGSIQDDESVERIGKRLLMDRNEQVRKAAAFALGQTKHPDAERILLGAIMKEKDPEVVFEILQAYGKTTSEWNLNHQSFLSDTIKSAGLAWSLYRTALRGQTSTRSNEVAMQLLGKEFSLDTRLGAAHYFARSAKGYPPAENKLIGAATSDSDPKVRMAAALSLSKNSSDSTLLALKTIIKDDLDTRVVINAIRALRAYPYDQIKHYLYEALRHKDVHVGIASSEIIIETLPAEQWIDVSSIINQVDHWRIVANLYEAALKASGNKDLASEVQERYKRAVNPYEKAWLLGALRHYHPAFSFVYDELKSADTAVLRSAAAQSLAVMGQIKGLTPQLKARLAESYRLLMESENDTAVLGLIAATLADSTLGYKSMLRDHAFLYQAKRRLSLPEHNEALQAIESAIAYFENKKQPDVPNEFNHPINWDVLKNIRQDQRATIKTTRGNIVIRLLVNESPGAVANFVQLVQRDYFDHKPVHRVVPNFVIQAGCKRGDGWGSEDYSIRSEFSPRRYRTGSVGMASAGKDTEGTQWFITHSPTPHLDGRYTIFAEVVEGMQAVHYLQVGDKITDVVLDDSKVR